MTTDPRITKAKRIVGKAVKEATEARTEPGVNRSTATRAAYKIKADALDAVAEALAAKPAKK